MYIKSRRKPEYIGEYCYVKGLQYFRGKSVLPHVWVIVGYDDRGRGNKLYIQLHDSHLIFRVKQSQVVLMKKKDYGRVFKNIETTIE